MDSRKLDRKLDCIIHRLRSLYQIVKFGILIIFDSRERETSLLFQPSRGISLVFHREKEGFLLPNIIISKIAKYAFIYYIVHIAYNFEIIL